VLFWLLCSMSQSKLPKTELNNFTTDIERMNWF
jgi:hypothetical protein